MMLFLPAGLGVYILTNSVLGIVQQQLTEKFAPKTSPSPATADGGASVRPKSARPNRREG
jgi:membrane protein insertase Oxa1/YidC/SpoIIIJ